MSGTIVADTDPTAIESGSSWNGQNAQGQPVIVTFSFLTSLPSYDDSIGGFTDQTIGSFSTFTTQEQTQAITALDQWAAASGIVFVEVPSGEEDVPDRACFRSLCYPERKSGNKLRRNRLILLVPAHRIELWTY